MKLPYALLPLAVFLLSHNVLPLAVSHLDLESPNTACDGKSTCEYEPGAERSRLGDHLVDWKDRNCLCDAQCAKYGDCCIDSPHFVAAEQRRSAASFSCVELRQFGGIYMLTTCPPEWSKAEIRSKCEDDNPSLRDPVANMPVTSHRTGLTYRNAHCAVCHGDLHPNKTDLWKPRLECPNLMQSLIPNMTVENISRALSFEHDQNQWIIRLPTDNGTKNYNCNVDPVLPETSEHIVRRCPVGIIRTCALNWTNAEVRNRCETHTALVFYQNDGYRNTHCAICNNIPIQNLACIRATSRVHDYTREFSPKAFAVLFDLAGASGDMVGQERACPHLDQLYDPFFGRCRNVVCPQEHQDYHAGHCISVLPDTDSTEDNLVNNDSLRNNSALTDEVSYTGENKSSHFRDCPKFLLEVEEYQLLEDDTVYIPAYDRKFDQSDFYIGSDGRMAICSDEGIEFVDKFNTNMGYVTIAGLGVSVVFLILHLTAFALLPELRNLSGKNLACLCVSLLAAYCAFIIGQFLETGRVPCTVVAVVTHYFFLASFSWMLTMAFDVWRTLRLATSELRVSAGKQWRKFAVYSTWSWAVPAIFVVAAIATDNAPSDAVSPDFRPEFGLETCWFSHRYALLVFFAVPLALVMILNIAFFSSSAHMIFSTTSTTRFTSSSGTQRDFRLYIRLALVMGLTWTVGLIAGYLNVEGLWYTFIALNTLQGLFIFLAFTCTEKVVRSFADSLSRCWKKSRRRDGLRVDGKQHRPPSFSWSGVSSSSTRKSHLGSGSESSSHHKEPSNMDTLY
ncbi:hypothetical protein C0J52_09872 [Blattella germanica]|nr:hypothetical protein C0J52_09872 [Blattella germanica]